MHDVAQRAGVSYQTVSRVLNNSCNVSQATREKIENAIKELHYVPNLLAQQLGKSERKVVGVINVCRCLQAPSDLVEGIRHYARERGYDILITLIDKPEIDELTSCINHLKAQLVTKVLVNIPLPSETAQQIVSENPDITFVFLDIDPFCPVLNVSFNPCDGTLASIRLLKELGHRKVVLIPGPKDVISSDLRFNSWLDGLRTNGMEPVGSEHGDWSAQSGFSAMMELMRRTKDFTAVLVANDQMALGAMSALTQCQLKVPEDISVVGYDDTTDSAFFDPPLTTVSLDRDRQCRVAIEKLLSDNTADEVSAVLPTTLTVRKSCAEVNQHKYSTANLAEELRSLAAKIERGLNFSTPS